MKNWRLLLAIASGIAAVITLVTSIPPSEAVFGGTSAVGDKRVVSLLSGQNVLRSGCSGVLMSERIVISAAHCLGNPGKTYTSEVYEPQNLWVAQPGADLNVDDHSTRVRVARVILTNGYDNTWKPQENNIATQKDDIAFLFLEKILVAGVTSEIASMEDIATIKANRLFFTHIGYGLKDVGTVDGKPYLTTLRSYVQGSARYPNNPSLDRNTVTSEETIQSALCGGDSGSPWYATVNGVEKLVAVTVAASGCQSTGGGTGGTLGTAIYPYLAMMKAQWTIFLKEYVVPSQPLQVLPVNTSLPLIQRSEGCDATNLGALQILENGQWRDFMWAQGWARVANCPSTHPFQPWVRASIPENTEIRWRLWATGAWEVFTPPYKYHPSNAFGTPIPSPTKASVPLTLTPLTDVPRVQPTISVKKITTIKCKKGLLVKSVKGLNPVCPKGFTRIKS